MAKRHTRGRPVNGILLLDKPIGRTSNHVLQEVKRLYRAEKAGHTGSLDPLASGMLPICFGAATKVSTYLLDADKTYWLQARLGQTTTTGDADGEILREMPVPDMNLRRIRKQAEQFQGEIMQIPPMYSALKHQGKPLYALAREGIEIEREARPVSIYELEILALQEAIVEMRVQCSKGTYVRTLVEDLGNALGCGAHVIALRRLAAGPYGEDASMYTLDRLRALAAENPAELDVLLLPADSALDDIPVVQLNPDLLYYLRLGQAVQVPRAPSSGLVRLYDAKQQFIGMGQVQDDGKIAPKRLFTG